jgi:thiamine-phosphate pyrophosphorylase
MLFRKRGSHSYMITGTGDDATVFARVKRAFELGVDLVQVRRRHSSGRDLEGFVRGLVDEIPGARERILVNDRLDVALSAGAAGVHLGSDGLPVGAVASATPAGFLVARSTHSRAEVEEAARAGASFVVFGPVFATPSKPGHPGVGLEALAEVVSSVDIPVFALGGMTPGRVFDVARTGACGVAGISVFEREDTLVELLKELAAISPPSPERRL